MNATSQVAATACEAGLNLPAAIAIVGCSFAIAVVLIMIFKYATK
jgi:hypothetical protein